MKSLVTILVCAFGLMISGVSFSSGGSGVSNIGKCKGVVCKTMDAAACNCSECCKIDEVTPINGHQPCVKKTPGQT